MKKNGIFKKIRFGYLCVFLLAAAAGLTLTGCGSDSNANLTPEGEAQLALEAAEAQFLADAAAAADLIPNAPTEYPAGELGYMVKLGKELIEKTDTHPLTSAYVGNSLQCSSCHLDGGRSANLASTFIGTAASFPAYNKRDKGIVTLQDRINSCFMRSMNGIRPPANSEASLAMTAYITWLSEGFPIKMMADKAVAEINRPFPNMALKNDYTADTANGEVLYDEKCANCHGSDGLGGTSEQPVWGDFSYNKGSGMATNFKHASWIQCNMPPGGEFTLKNQQALDIAAYINSHDRPDFIEADHLPYQDEMVVYHYGATEEVQQRRAEEVQVEEPPVEEPPAEEPPVEEPPVEEPPAIDGTAIFVDKCGGCHTGNGLGSGFMDITGKTAAQIEPKITVGPHSGGTSFGLTAEEIQAMAEVL